MQWLITGIKCSKGPVCWPVYWDGNRWTTNKARIYKSSADAREFSKWAAQPGVFRVIVTSVLYADIKPGPDLPDYLK